MAENIDNLVIEQLRAVRQERSTPVSPTVSCWCGFLRLLKARSGGFPLLRRAGKWRGIQNLVLGQSIDSYFRPISNPVQMPEVLCKGLKRGANASGELS